MKAFTIFFSLVIFSSKSLPNTLILEKEEQKVDTLSRLMLRDISFEKEVYVLHLLPYEKERDEIVIVSDKLVLGKILLPISNDELKNFAVNKISTISNGFHIEYSWGGGNNFYETKLLIQCEDQNFYLTKYTRNHKRIDKDLSSESNCTVERRIEFNEIDIYSLENDI